MLALVLSGTFPLPPALSPRRRPSLGGHAHREVRLRPSHDYNYLGEASVGPESRGAADRCRSAAVKAPRAFLPKASVQAGYVHSFVE